MPLPDRLQRLRGEARRLAGDRGRVAHLRGALTLVEVLAAVVLLAVLTTAAVPLLERLARARLSVDSAASANNFLYTCPPGLLRDAIAFGGVLPLTGQEAAIAEFFLHVRYLPVDLLRDTAPEMGGLAEDAQPHRWLEASLRPAADADSWLLTRRYLLADLLLQEQPEPAAPE